MGMRTLKTTKHRGMAKTVLDYLMTGEELTAIKAADMWKELNVRNKIGVLRSEGWPIGSLEEDSGNGGQYKVYSLDMDKALWPKEDGEEEKSA